MDQLRRPWINIYRCRPVRKKLPIRSLQRHRTVGTYRFTGDPFCLGPRCGSCRYVESSKIIRKLPPTQNIAVRAKVAQYFRGSLGCGPYMPSSIKPVTWRSLCGCGCCCRRRCRLSQLPDVFAISPLLVSSRTLMLCFDFSQKFINGTRWEFFARCCVSEYVRF